MITLLVDFNEIRNGEVFTRYDESVIIVVGDRVMLDDGGGESCEGTITRVTDRLVYARMDWDTWGAINDSTHE